MDSSEQPIALISVYNKDGIVELGQGLSEAGWKILASGGTAKNLKVAGISVQDVAELVGGKEILGHRVVTLSREIHAGLLATWSDPDVEEMERLGFPYIHLVVNDLYPLKEEVEKPEATLESVIEKTDIGGPCMLRSAAKGGRLVLCDAQDREDFLNWVGRGRPGEEEVIRQMRAKTEGYVADYCLHSAVYHSEGTITGVVDGWDVPLQFPS